jgi:predicted membrane-bound mannosyltransferase
MIMGAEGRIYAEAALVGICIAVTVWLLRAWLDESGVAVRAVSLLLAGGALCLLQAWLGRGRRG